jgi:flavodoxin
VKTIVIFYSFSGHTKAIATKLAADESADLLEIKDARKPSVAKAYLLGCVASLRGKAWPIASDATDLSAYDRIVVLSPIWAGNPPPAVNALFGRLPKDKHIAVKAVSASGKSACEDRIKAVVAARGSLLDSFENVHG